MSIPSNKENKNLEARLIIECSQTRILPDQVEIISNILSQQINWDYIFLVAGRNNVFPLIAWNLLKNFPEQLSVEIKNQLAEYFQEHTHNNLFLTLKLIEIVKLLDKAGISVLPFKGTTLAMRAYKNLALRQYCDLDILVKPKNFDETSNILSENGYSATSKANWLKRKVLFFTHKKDIVFVGSDTRVHIELHWKLSGSHFSLPFEISQLWNRLEKINLGGTEVNDLAFNDLFVYLCLHGSRHEWEKLSWICDLHELIQTFESDGTQINWDDVRQHAKNHGCEKVVELGLFLVQKFFGYKSNYFEYEKIENNSAYTEIFEQVEKRIFSQDFSPSLKKDKYTYLLALREKRTDRIKLYLVYLTFYLELMFTPNTLDKSIFHLPTFFSPLYYILRPVRLFLTYFNLNFLKKIRLKK